MAKWNIDPDHAVAEFIAKHMMVTPVHGQLNKVSGTIIFDPESPANASVDVEIDVAGLYTGVDRRDNHLRSPDFFDVEKFPKMYFKSTLIEVDSLNRCKVTGDLTIHGITRSVMFDVTFAGPSRFFDDEQNQMYTTFGFRATTCINREDYGLKWNVAIEDGGFMVSKYVDIIFNAEADLVNE
jgi:polyisoprenoid-binding protein YceI